MSRLPDLPYAPYAEPLQPRPAVLPAGTNFRRKTVFLILLFTLARLVLATVVELGNDEAYYWLYAQYLKWNYFDHPPMVAYMARLFTLDLRLEDHELFVRLGSILGCGLATWFLFKATAVLHSERAGWYAAVLYNTSLYAGIVAGLLLMPDSPQMVFWTFSMWMFALVVVRGGQWRHWLLFGLGAGLCIMSKVHGVFLWSGAGLYLLLQRRDWLLQPKPYAAALITALVVSPILFWNLEYDFATYKFHSQRVVISGWYFNLQNFYNELVGQIGFNNPVVVALVVVALLFGRRRMTRLLPRLSFLLYTGVPLALVLLFVALFRTVFPHWSGPAYVSLLPIAAVYLARVPKPKIFPAWLKAALVAVVGFMVCWPLVLRGTKGTWGNENGLALGLHDVTLDRYGWQDGGHAFGAFYADQVAQGKIAPNTPLVCNKWWGAHVEYYFALPAGIRMMGLGGLRQVHHYLWTNRWRRDEVNMEQAFSIVPSDELYDAEKAYQPYYRNIRLVKTITNLRRGEAARNFYVYHLSGWKGHLPEEGKE